MSKKSSLSEGLLPKLSSNEELVLGLISDEFLTAKQVSIRLKKSKSYVYRIVRNLKKKGVLTKSSQMVHNLGQTREPLRFSGKRVHAERFRVVFLDRGGKCPESGVRVVIDGNDVAFYDNVLMVYSNKSFFGETTGSAMGKSVRYWNRFFVRLENLYDLVLLKPRSENVSLVYCEVSDVENGLARKCEGEGERIRVYTSDGGRLWFGIDNSFNLHEAETYGKDAGWSMQDVVEPFFNDLRNGAGKLLVPSELQRLVQVNAENQSFFNKNLASHIDAIRTLSVAVNDLRSAVLKPSLEDVKACIGCLDDVCRLDGKIRMLSVVDRERLGLWLFERFGLF